MKNLITETMLKAIMPFAPKSKRDAALPILNHAAFAYEINNEKRIASWLATIAVESGELKYQEEIASGVAYENRRDLGNTQPGDGKRFKGHGRIQITGRANHTSYTNYLRKSGHLPFIDFVANPQALAREPYATDSAAWFFAVHIDANPLADANNFLTIQVKVNGRNKKTGLPNHWTERQAYYQRALRVIPDNFQLEGEEGFHVDDMPAALHTDEGYPDFEILPETSSTDVSRVDDEKELRGVNVQPASTIPQVDTSPISAPDTAQLSDVPLPPQVKTMPETSLPAPAVATPAEGAAIGTGEASQPVPMRQGDFLQASIGTGTRIKSLFTTLGLNFTTAIAGIIEFGESHPVLIGCGVAFILLISTLLVIYHMKQGADADKDRRNIAANPDLNNVR